jgi:hypothetical protein
MTRIAFFAGIVLLIASCSYATTAEEMLAGCRSVAQAPVRDGQVRLPEASDAQKCWGAFIVLNEVIRLRESGKWILHACTSHDVTRTQLIAIFVEYVDRNPKVRNEQFTMTALNAIIEAFPCGNTKSTGHWR